eukprot:6222451-Amphidinium_carterae.1
MNASYQSVFRFPQLLPIWWLQCSIYPGSTGKPKGVVVEHRGLVHRVRWFQASLCAGVALVRIMALIAMTPSHPSPASSLCLGRIDGSCSEVTPSS